MNFTFMRMIGFLALGVLIAPGMGHTETLHGQVESVNVSNQSLRVRGQDSGETREYYLKSGSNFTGVSSLHDLKPGDAVALEGFQPNSGRWESSSLTLEARGDFAPNTSSGMTVVNGNPNTFPGNSSKN